LTNLTSVERRHSVAAALLFGRLRTSPTQRRHLAVKRVESATSRVAILERLLA
jgi:hypothetical protein